MMSLCIQLLLYFLMQCCVMLVCALIGLLVCVRLINELVFNFSVVFSFVGQLFIFNLSIIDNNTMFEILHALHGASSC